MIDTATIETLDLLEAITEIRVANPEFRPAILASLRIAALNGHLSAGRLFSLNHDGSIAAIIAHGDSEQDEESDRNMVQQVFDEREIVQQSQTIAFPLGRDQRCYGVLILENPKAESAPLLAHLFLQWHAVAEFVTTQKAELIDENFALRSEIKMQFSERNIIGTSSTFRHVIEQARRVAASSATVLIEGETGTGKELIARLIHEHSPRANRPFITVNCGALSESLLETELFGHVKGAFTGAVADHKGRFEAANEGTIFLDEIGEISESMQVRLLRVLQEMEVVRVGDTRARKLDVRIIAATNRHLEDEVKKNNFRSDLYYRLNVVYLSLPSLRQRREDIPLLMEHFLSVYCQKNFKMIDMISKDAMEIMKAYHWPGNIRELENCIEKMVVMAPGRELTTELLPISLMAYHAPDDPETGSDPTRTNESFEVMLKRYMQAQTATCVDSGSTDLYKRVRAKWERHLFECVLEATRNNKSKAARLLGITRNTLNGRLGELCEVKREWAID